MNTTPVIPRIEDLPYISSPPIAFTYRSQATVSAGKYVWNDKPSVLTPKRPLMVNGIYYFRNITLSADIDEMDFQAAISVIPTFQMYLKSNAKNIHFREPIYMVKYYQQFDYRLSWITRQNNDELFAGFQGTLNQIPVLIGKNSIKLSAIVSCQEIVDESFVRLFEQKYPQVRN